jgi:8-oxo-dGTP pyrophosphatase MutT (NUDIX family)
MKEQGERLRTTTSVGLCLGYRRPNYDGFPDLVLVTKRDSNQLGLIAGSLERGEEPFRAALREAEEEANLPPYTIIFLNSRPNVIIVPKSDTSSVGLIYDAEFTEPMNPDGYEPESSEVSFVKPYSIDELLALVKEPDRWYRPEFNLAAAKNWIREYVYWKYGTWEGMDFAHKVLSEWGLTQE